MNNNVKLFRREWHWTQDHLAASVGVARECSDAIEKRRFMPSIALEYDIATTLEQYVLVVFPPQEPSAKSSPCTAVLGQQIHTAFTRGISVHSRGLK